MSKIGYIRVSTEHQETARQQEIMCDYQVNRIFSEKISVSTQNASQFAKDRPQLRAMLDYVREGDTLYIESISRLGRSAKDLLNIIDTLTEKGVTLISHKEKIDTDTPAGKFMLTVFAALSQLEREQFKQRQREGIEIAKAQGKYTGRKPTPIDWTRFGDVLRRNVNSIKYEYGRFCFGKCFDFAHIRDACIALDSGKVNGKIVVKAV